MPEPMRDSALRSEILGVKHGPDMLFFVFYGVEKEAIADVNGPKPCGQHKKEPLAGKIKF